MVKLVSFVSGLFKSRKAEVAVADPMRIHISHNHDADRTGNRIGIAMIAFTVFCVVVGGRLVQYGVRSPETVSSILPSDRLIFVPCHYMPNPIKSQILMKLSNS
jgi:hypothetical protein